MPSPFPNLPVYQRGRVTVLDHASRALAGNPWGDPTHRDLLIYRPPGYDAEPTRRYPVMLLLPSFSSTGESLLARGMTDMSIASRIDHLIADGCPPFIAVLPDAMSSVGGTQFVDSPGIGNYASWLVDEVMPFVDDRMRTTRRWAAAGRSSGGFGALHLAMTYPGRFAAIASMAGDMGFDLGYLGEIPAAVGALRAAGGPIAFLERFWAQHRPGSKDFAAISLLCISAAYTRPDQRCADGFPARLPVDLDTGAVDFELFADWRRFDPVVRAAHPDAQAALSALDLLWLDAGSRDEYNLQLGARRLCAALAHAGVPHHYEEFDGGHRGTAYRWDTSLPVLARALDAD